MAVIRNVQVEVEGEEQTFPLGALAENIEESTEKQFVSASEKKKLNAQPIKVTLTAVGWSGSAAPYKQTVQNAEIKANGNYILTADADGLALSAWKAYQKAWGIIATGSAVPADGSATFSVYKKPATDCNVYLVEV